MQINGIEAVELLATASPADAAAVRNRGRKPVVERAAAQPLTINGIEGVIFGTASSGPGSVIRLDSADPALAAAARRRGQRVLVVVNSAGTVVAATPEAPANVSVPTVSGTLVVGQTLVASEGVWTGSPAPTFSYQWQADTAGNGTFANIGGATSNTYVLTASEAGDDVRVVVTATNGVPPDASANSVATDTIAAQDTTPTAFSFTDITGATLSTVYESNTITVAGTNSPATVTITGGEYSKNGGSYTSAAGTADSGDTFKVRHTSSGSNSTATNTALTIGGVSDTYTTTTAAAADTTPDAFTFTDITDADLSTLYTSNTITVTGINASTAVTITGGEYSKNGGAYTSSAGTAVVNDTFAVRHTSSGSNSTATDTVLTIGGVSDTYTTTTEAAAGDWWDDAAYDDMAVVADFNNDRYALPLETELVTTPDFASSTGWTHGAEWTISGGKATKAATGSTLLRTSIAPTAGRLYRATYTLSNRGGTGPFYPQVIGGTTIDLGTGDTANGTYTYYFTAVSGNNEYVISGASGASGDIDNMSVKEITLTTSGSDLVTNGTFDTNTTGWTSVGSSLASTSGELVLTATGTSYPQAYQEFTTVSGKVYEFKVTSRRGTTTASVAANVQPGGGGTAHVTTPANATTSNVSSTLYFTATGATSRVSVYINTDPATIGHTAIFDTISVKELIYPKREATFDEVFAYTAASTTARTYTDDGGVLRDMEHEQNLQLYSEDMGNGSGWNNTATSFTANAITAPDGEMTADLVAETNVNASHFTVYNTTITVGQVVTSSCYFKRGNHDWVMLGVTDNVAHVFRVYFDIANGTIGGTSIVGSAAVTASDIEDVGGGWYRCQASGTLSTGANARIYTNSATADGNPATANGRERYEWGMQLERGSPATSYKPTGGSISGVNARRMTYANGTQQLRLENAGTNLAWRSQEFENAYWSANQLLAVGTNAVAAPDGTTTADKIMPNTSSNLHVISDPNGRGAGTFTFSVFAKAAGYPRLGLRVYDGTAYQMKGTFDISNGTVVSTVAGSLSIQSYGNGWYRCVCTGTTAGNMGITSGWAIESLPSGNLCQDTFTGDGTSGAYIWGAQVEASSFATDYIPTTTASVTRAIETCRMSPLVEAILQRAAGSVVVRCDLTATGTFRNLVGVASSNALLGALTGTTQIGDWNGSGTNTATLGSGSTSDPMGAAMGFDGSGRSHVGNGGTVAVSGSAAASTRTTIYLARTSATDDYGAGYYDYFAVSPERLPDATLQAEAVAA